VLALVIGGNGFIGSSLVERLRDAGHGVRVLDQTSPRSDVDWNGIQYVIGNLGETTRLPSLLAGTDIVFHLASSTVPGTSNLDPIADVQSNLVGVLNLCAAMIATGQKRLIFFSSGGTVYGDPQVLPVPETHPLHPISSYGVVKVAVENYLFMYEKLGFLKPLILRPSNPFGPRQSTAGLQGVIAAFLGKALRSEEVRIWGDGETVRDYIYIDDLITLAVTAATTNITGPVNVGSGRGYSLNQIVKAVRQTTGATLPIKYEPKRDYDVAEVVLDTSRALKELGWRPLVELSKGISMTWQALLKKHAQ
jgi:UDP-glucose 4-epimerase